ALADCVPIAPVNTFGPISPVGTLSPHWPGHRRCGRRLQNWLLLVRRIFHTSALRWVIGVPRAGILVRGTLLLVALPTARGRREPGSGLAYARLLTATMVGRIDVLLPRRLSCSPAATSRGAAEARASKADDEIISG